LNKFLSKLPKNKKAAQRVSLTLDGSPKSGGPHSERMPDFHLTHTPFKKRKDASSYGYIDKLISVFLPKKSKKSKKFSSPRVLL